MKVDANAFYWQRKINPKYWSFHAFDKSVKCNHTTNNMTESWNAWLRDIRKAPIITLIEHIRKKMMHAIIEKSWNVKDGALKFCLTSIRR